MDVLWRLATMELPSWERRYAQISVVVAGRLDLPPDLPTGMGNVGLFRGRPP